MMKLLPDDPRLTWQGTISLEHTKQGVRPWRLPFERRQFFPPEMLHTKATCAAGVRISFYSDTSSVNGMVVPNQEPSLLDLYCDGQFVATADLTGKDCFAFNALSKKKKLIELWLPQSNPIHVTGLNLDDDATLEPFEDTRPKWLAYGSSITQCAAAESPSQTWPAIVAREQQLNLTCLGYGGQCHLDIMIARMMRELPADFISLCVGINIHGSNSLGMRAFRPALISFISILREKHVHTPIVVMSPIFSPPRETTPNNVNLTLVQMREFIEEVVLLFKNDGDKNIHYINGLDIFGKEYEDLLPDQLHPNAEGYKLMGKHYLEKAAKKYFKL